MIKQIISNIRKKNLYLEHQDFRLSCKIYAHFQRILILARINIAAGVLIITQVIIFKDKSMRDSQH